MENEITYFGGMSAKGYPIYTKTILYFASIYIQNGVVVKNRNGVAFDTNKEIENYNNIVIEKNGIVNIYCKENKVPYYKNVINYIKPMYSSFNIDERIIINIKK